MSPGAQSEAGLGTLQNPVPHQRHTTARLGHTNARRNSATGLERPGFHPGGKISLFPGHRLSTSVHPTVFQGQRHSSAPILEDIFPHHHYHKGERKKKVYPEPLQREVIPDSVPSVDDHSNHPPCLPVPGQATFPLPSLPAPYTAPRPQIPLVAAHESCILPVTAGCKEKPSSR